MTKQVWQVSGGPQKRAYDDIFIHYGVALIGPGDAGAYDLHHPKFSDHYIRRFAVDICHGDFMLLRTGLSTILAVGIVDGGDQYLPQFDEVNGWDIQHDRRVRWYALPAPYTFDTPIFGANPPRLSRTNQQEAVDFALRFVNSPPDRWKSAPLPALPPEDPPLREIPVWLQPLVAQVDDLVPLYKNPAAFGDLLPAEDELIAHYVVPVLRLLGWQVEQIAVKWRNVDVCVFRALPRTPENCHFIIEAKRLGAGVEGALEQAQGYLSVLGINRNIVVTDGIRYRMYSAENNFAPVAYANLARLKQPPLQLFQFMRRP